MGVPSVEISTLDTQLSFPAATLAYRTFLAASMSMPTIRRAARSATSPTPCPGRAGRRHRRRRLRPSAGGGGRAGAARRAGAGDAASAHRQLSRPHADLAATGNAHGQRLDLATVFGRLPPGRSRLIEIEDLVVAARQVAATERHLRVARPSPPSAPGCWPRSPRRCRRRQERLPMGTLPTGARPGLQAAARPRRGDRDRRSNAVRAPAACREALAELGRPCPLLPGAHRHGGRRNRPAPCSREFSLHAANFAGRVAAPLLLPELHLWTRANSSRRTRLGGPGAPCAPDERDSSAASCGRGSRASPARRPGCAGRPAPRPTGGRSCASAGPAARRCWSPSAAGWA